MRTKLETKKEIRARSLALRDAISLDERPAKNERIRDLLLALDEYKSARTVMLYVSFRSEVDTLRIIRLSIEAGKTVVLPKVNVRERLLETYRVDSLNDLISGYQGIPEPGIVKGRDVSVSDIDLVTLPGAAFDRAGGRIGYGGGYYDRLLAEVRPDVSLIALAYAEQIVEKIPMETHDRPVQKIVTDTGVIQCR